MAHLQLAFLQYRESDERSWIAGRYGLLTKSTASPFVKAILVEKARSRPGCRFFGEAYVAARVAHQEGWYGSFKWLTSAVWTSDRRLSGHRAEFREALRTHFRGLDDVQQRARHFAEIVGLEPVPPDLWLIVDGEHRFVEVKRPRDSVAQRQLAGLALIARWLTGDIPVSVWIMQLHRNAVRPRAAPDLVRHFSDMYRAAGDV